MTNTTSAPAPSTLRFARYSTYASYLSGTRWLQVVQEMSTQDPTISGILFAISMLMRQVPWSVQPFAEDDADKELAAFVEECLHDMREPWPMTLSEILSFLPWGWAALEKIYKLRAGAVTRADGTPDKLRSRCRRTTSLANRQL
jgi:hypothetical protein